MMLIFVELGGHQPIWNQRQISAEWIIKNCNSTKNIFAMREKRNLDSLIALRT